MSAFIQMVLQDDYDWKEVFAFAGEPGGHNPSNVIDQITGQPTDPFCIADVEHVEMMVEGENDGPDWIIVGRLKDSRWFYLTAGCDYTGWD